MIRLVLTRETADAIERHLLSSAPLEQGVFCLLRSGRGMRGVRLLAGEVLYPPPGAWEIQLRQSLRPSAKWISSCISRAINVGAGLLWVHSHPGRNMPPGLSVADVRSFEALGRTIAPMLDGPLAAAVCHPTGWSGQLWAEGGGAPVEQVVSLGRSMRFLSPLRRNGTESDLDSRQLDALGLIHHRLRTLRVAVVGCGGTGSPIAEQLVRMGVGEVLLIDHDILDTPSNLRRMFGSRATDLKNTSAKVDVLGRHLVGLGLGAQVNLIKDDVREEGALRSLLDADVVMLATDSHSSRAAVNDLAYSHLIPIIDVGVRVGSRAKKVLCSLVAEVRVLAPSTPCLWCRDVLSGEVIRVENLPEGERKQLRREGYVTHGIDEPTPSVIALTVLGSSIATSALLTMLSSDGEHAPSGFLVDSFSGFAHVIRPEEPREGCRCRTRLGYGDQVPFPCIDQGRLSLRHPQRI